MAQLRSLGSILGLGIAAVALLSIAMAAQQKSPQGTEEKSPPAETTLPENKAPAPKDDEEKKDLYHFMRLKLEASGKVLEGLAVEDFDLIQEGAEQLNKMSTAEKWRVSNDPLYRNFSGEFQRLTKDLAQAAEDENLDRAALKWVDATLSCIECHQFTRQILIAGNLP